MLPSKDARSKEGRRQQPRTMSKCPKCGAEAIGEDEGTTIFACKSERDKPNYRERQDSFYESKKCLRNQLAAANAEIERLGKENDTLKAILAKSELPCVYCGLSSQDMARCQRGFPGCARADDMLLQGIELTPAQPGKGE